MVNKLSILKDVFFFLSPTRPDKTSMLIVDPPRKKKKEEIQRERERERERKTKTKSGERGWIKPKEGDTHTSLLIH